MADDELYTYLGPCCSVYIDSSCGNVQCRSNLNSAAVILVNDLIKPFAPDASDKDLAKYAKYLTVVLVICHIAAIYSSSIIGLF